VFEFTTVGPTGQPGATTKFGWDCATNAPF
jgi:hypothetical protein